jgi:hypothetical protein
MKSAIKVLLSSCSALLLSVFAGNASAAWQELGNIAYNPNAQQAVAITGEAYILGGPRVPGGYHVKRSVWNGGSFPLWETLDGSVGTAITASQNRELWLVNENSEVWRRADGGGWSHLPTNNCDGGGHVIINQSPENLPHNTLAVGEDANHSDTIFVVSDGTLRWWNGACWSKMPNVPSATVQDVAIDVTHPASTSPYAFQFPWVLTTVGTIFRWDGTTWLQIPNALGTQLNNKALIVGIDATSLWGYNGTYFTGLTSWTGGAIRSLGTAWPFGENGPLYGQSSEILVKSNGMVWSSIPTVWK